MKSAKQCCWGSVLLTALAWVCGLAGWLGGAALRGTAAAGPTSEAEPGTALVTNTLEAIRLARMSPAVLCPVRLEGVVLWTNAARREFILQDGTGAIRIDCEPRGPALPDIGRSVRLEGLELAAQGKLCSVLVNNDGLHSVEEKSESVYLTAGRHPILVDWFNGPSRMELQVDYAGPGLPRQRIPDAALYRAVTDPAGGTSNLVQGLDFRCYEGAWTALPNFDQLPVVRAGQVANFDLGVRTRERQVGLCFSGFIEIATPGRYTFWVRSDDGARLCIGGPSPQLTVRKATLPAAQRLLPGQPLPAGRELGWACVEGVVSAASIDAAQGLELQLSQGTNRLYLEVQDAQGAIPPLFSRVRATGVCRSRQASGGSCIAGQLLVSSLDQVEVLVRPVEPVGTEPTTLAALRRMAALGQRVLASGSVTGCVYAVSPSGQWLVVTDRSAAALVETDASGLQPGQRVVLSGTWVVEADALRLHDEPLIDHDGVHSRSERMGTMFLSAGKHPLHLSWFNKKLPACLELNYSGPGFARQRVSGAALFRPELAESGAVSWVPGLDYRVYEGSWSALPSPSQLVPGQEGVTAEIDPAVGTVREDVAVEFWGFLEVPQAGTYHFALASDDGSRLFIGEVPRVQVLGNQVVPEPRQVSTGQGAPLEQPDQWVEVEGTVRFAREQAGGLHLELSSGSGRMEVRVVESAGSEPLLLLNSRVRVTGVCQSTYTADGQTVVGKLLVPGTRQLEVLEPSPTCWAEHPRMPIGWLASTNFPESREPLVHVSGRVVDYQAGEWLLVQDESGRARVETAQVVPGGISARVEALGRWGRADSNLVLHAAVVREMASAEPAHAVLPLLTTVEQVKRLTREEAKRGYPVRIRGIITEASSSGFFIQDATWAIAVRWRSPAGELPARIGDYWELEGVTGVEFAPLIQAHSAQRLGPGVLPAPLRPSWDQLINGSLDTLYVEVQGIVASVERDAIILLTQQGKLKVTLGGVPVSTLKHYENALIRVRGCVVPERNRTTQQVEVGQMRLANASVSVGEAAPTRPFAAPFKHAGELFLFDPQASAVQRVRIAGQVVHERAGEYFLMDGTNGLRVIPRRPAWVQPGDWVEAVGFVELGGPSPSLREAILRRNHSGRMPLAVDLPKTPPVSREYDSRLVRVQARLAGISLDRADRVLELQAGGRGFLARLEARRGALRGVVPGSLLEVTGVYAGKGGDRATGGDIDSFELLLNSPTDIQVLSRPSWWTAQHTLAVLGSMAVVILGGVIWISLLRRQVEERSRQLSLEMKRHERTERQRALEEERARIARDLHDDLGATLTQIRFLSALESRDASVPEAARSQMGEISEKSRQMVASLDEIVWALNPTNDSVSSLATYLCQVAEELFRASPIRCRLDVADGLPALALTSEVRHDLYLAVREALNNVAKHSRATEAWLRIHWRADTLWLLVEDNGTGFVPPPAAERSGGLVNMRQRVEKAGGRFACESRPGVGTVCRMELRLGAMTALETPEVG